MKLFYLKINLLLILTLAIHGIVISQKYLVYQGDTINHTDEEYKKQGVWINFDATGSTVIEKGTYRDNKKDGIWTTYFPNGKIKHEITFKGGVASGSAKFFYETGQLWEQGVWNIDHWVGKYQFFYPSGQIAYDWNYNNIGKRTGEQRYYHENGNVKYSGVWENGKTVGSLKVYDESGNLSSERVYAGGKFQQTVTHSADTDADNSMSNMSNARFTGTGDHTIYNLTGKVEKKGYFLKGQLINGEQYIYDSKGNLSSVLLFENGELKSTRHID